MSPRLALGKKVMAAAGKSDQRDEDEEAEERPPNSTRHERDNARNSVNDCSRLPAQQCVNHTEISNQVPMAGIADPTFLRETLIPAFFILSICHLDPRSPIPDT
jgi:hypothetical protein